MQECPEIEMHPHAAGLGHFRMGQAVTLSRSGRLAPAPYQDTRVAPSDMRDARFTQHDNLPRIGDTPMTKIVLELLHSTGYNDQCVTAT
jgi:hypothetical protein